MKKIILTVFIVGGLLMWAYVWGGPGISSVGGGGGSLSPSTSGQAFVESAVTPPYVNTLTSDAQAQLDNKQPLDAQLTDLADGTISGDFVNTAYPWLMEEILSGETVANRIRILPSMTGKAGFFAQVNSTATDMQYTDTITISGLTIPLATTTAGVTDSVATLRFDPTASQLVSGVSAADPSGVTEAVIAGVTNFLSITISGTTNVADVDDHIIATLPYNITIKEISAKLRRNGGADGTGITATINVQECTPANSCADMLAADWVLSGATTGTLYKSAQSDFSDSVATRKNELRVDVVSGTTDSDLTVGVVYWINRE